MEHIFKASITLGFLVTVFTVGNTAQIRYNFALHVSHSFLSQFSLLQYNNITIINTNLIKSGFRSGALLEFSEVVSMHISRYEYTRLVARGTNLITF